MAFGILTCNPIIDCGLLAWFLAQLIKVVLDVVLLRKLDLRRFFSSGGMPSSHSALVLANVRRGAGDTARLVNQLLEHVERLTAEDFAENLREVMGHTPLQVLMGALLGFGVGLLV